MQKKIKNGACKARKDRLGLLKGEGAGWVGVTRSAGQTLAVLEVVGQR